MFPRIWALVLLLATLGTAVLAAGQETTGTIAGVARDQSGAVLPGVTVTVTFVPTGSTRDPNAVRLLALWPG